MQNESFTDFVLDQLEELPNITARRMFGGFGLYCEKYFFGIISKSELYFKTDATTRTSYTQRGMKPFTPNPQQILKNYLEVPVDILEDRQSLVEWAREAVRVAKKRHK
jgi:DNA transformation protein and related proteins